jgi:chemotaxis protein MotB
LLLLVMGACGYAIYTGWGMLQKANEAADHAVTARDEAVKAQRKAEDERAELQAKLAQAVSDRDEAAAKASTLQANLNDTEAALKALKATTSSLEDKLKAEIKNGEIKLSQSGDRIQVDLVDKILFNSGEAALSPKGQEVLTRVAAVLKTIDDRQIQVSGHTDDSPIKNEDLKKQFPTNWELSTARAVNVVRFLTETGQVPAKHMLAAGYGQFHPIAANANPKGRASNRRIEILLTPLLAAAPLTAKKK